MQGGGFFTNEAKYLLGFSFGHRGTPTGTELIRAMRACSVFAQELEQSQQMFAEEEEAETNATTQGGIRLHGPSHFYHVLGVPRDADERSIIQTHATLSGKLPYVATDWRSSYQWTRRNGRTHGFFFTTTDASL